MGSPRGTAGRGGTGPDRARQDRGETERCAQKKVSVYEWRSCRLVEYYFAETCRKAVFDKLIVRKKGRVVVEREASCGVCAVFRCHRLDHTTLAWFTID